jgi:hypothetical protein
MLTTTVSSLDDDICKPNFNGSITCVDDLKTEYIIVCIYIWFTMFIRRNFFSIEEFDWTGIRAPNKMNL